MTRLRADDLELAYDRRVVAEQLGLEIPDGSFTVIVGPNACGKTTLLRALARLLRPRRGGVADEAWAMRSLILREVSGGARASADSIRTEWIAGPPAQPFQGCRSGRNNDRAVSSRGCRPADRASVR